MNAPMLVLDGVEMVQPFTGTLGFFVGTMGWDIRYHMA
jgi:hypothetical protein